MTTIAVRWVYRTVCTVVTLVVGVVAAIFGATDIVMGALKDLWTLVKDAIYSAVGAVIFGALRLVDLVQTTLRLQPAKRRLTVHERRELLYPIFRDSLAYDAIELVVGPAGLLGVSGRPFTMGFTIYMPAYDERTLVHECVHTWQFQFGGFGYIGNSALNQLDSRVFHTAYDPYEWRSRLDAGDSWYTLTSVEAQARFVDRVWQTGRFHFNDPTVPDAVGRGAFFREDESGHNIFEEAGVPYTAQANAAWRILRTS